MTLSPFHPEVLARDSVHKHRQKGACASDDRSVVPRPACDCAPTQAEIREAWQRRAKMARARQTAGRLIVPTGDTILVKIGDTASRFERLWRIETDDVLDDIDREALRREEQG